jgi:hypothetical protein
VVILNTSDSGCAALILTPTNVQHVPFAGLGFTELTVLKKLLRYAIAKDGRAFSPSLFNRAHIEGLVRQIPFASDSLQLLRLPFDARHIGRASDLPVQPDDIFRFVLAVLWVSVVKLVIDCLELEVNYPSSLQLFLTVKLTVIFRNVMNLRICGGALRDNLFFFQYTQRGSTFPRRWNVFPNILCRRTRRPSVPFSATPLLPLNRSR